jgi:hypothetical protein
MNKIICAKQIKKSENIIEEDDYNVLDDSMNSGYICDENLDVLNKFKKFKIEDKLHATECKIDNCVNICAEINKLKEECDDLEHKCIFIDYVKSEQLFEISEKISELCKAITKLIDIIELNEGTRIDHLDYTQLTKLEMGLMKLLIKIRLRISKVR